MFEIKTLGGKQNLKKSKGRESANSPIL